MGDLAAGIEWTRPAGLAALVLPLAVLLLSLRRARPAAVAVGTLALWRAVRAVRPRSGARRRRRIPLERVLMVLALALGALALAGPRRPRAAAPLVWRVLLDRSPSLFLEHTDAAGRPSGGGSRLDVALARLRAAAAAEGARVELWLEEQGAWRALGADPPQGAPRPALPEPRWRVHDQPGAVWLTDREPEPAPRFAGVIASGGGPVFGPVSSSPATLEVWDGERIRAAARSDEPRVALADDVPEELASFVRAWAQERGYAVEARPAAREPGAAGAPGDADVELVVRGVAPEASDVHGVSARGAGWSLGGEAAAVPLAGGSEVALEPWLRADAGAAGSLTVVASGPGVVVQGFRTLDPPGGDPAAFAVAWAALLDGALLPARGVVALDERLPAGPSVWRPPARAELAAAPPERLPAWLAMAAAALALAGGCVALARSR